MIWSNGLQRKNSNSKGRRSQEASILQKERRPRTMKSCLRNEEDDPSDCTSTLCVPCHRNGSFSSKEEASYGSDSTGSSLANQSQSQSESSVVDSSSRRQSSETSSGTQSNVSFSKASSRQSSSGRSSRSIKNVRFYAVEIREYDRTVGDHPSCSSGPPISIGWNYRESLKVNVNKYESIRGTRRVQGEMTLSRRERERLLDEWGFPSHIIAEGVRSALKVKHQRKQTVINAGKIAKLEEAFEGAAKRLKRALMLRRRTSDHVRELQEQANRATTMSVCTTESVEKHSRDFSPSACNEGTADLELMKPTNSVAFNSTSMQAAVSNAVDEAAEEGSVINSFHRNLKSDGDDATHSDAYTLGATTLGNNSASPSMIAMEKFYQELELELFGDEAELPSMVGQTLEVPQVSLSAQGDAYEDGVNDDITIASGILSAQQDGEPEGSRSDLLFHKQTDYGEHALSFQSDHGYYHVCNQREYSQRNVSLDPCVAHDFEDSYPHHSESTRHILRRGRSNSYDNIEDKMNRYQKHYSAGTQIIRENVQRLPHPLAHWHTECNWHYANTRQMRHDVFRSNGGSFDGPRVCHIPLHGHPNQWMDGNVNARTYLKEAITIVEDHNNGPPVVAGSPYYF